MATPAQFYDQNGELRLDGSLVGGGGASPFTVLGPYTLSYVDLDPGDYLVLAALADGTIVWRVAVVVRENFTTPSETVRVLLGTGGNNILGMTDLHEADVTGGDGAWPTSGPAAIEAWTAAGLVATPIPLVGIAQHSAQLLAVDTGGGNTAGIVDVYALVSVPT